MDDALLDLGVISASRNARKASKLGEMRNNAKGISIACMEHGPFVLIDVLPARNATGAFPSEEQIARIVNRVRPIEVGCVYLTGGTIQGASHPNLPQYHCKCLAFHPARQIVLILWKCNLNTTQL